MARSSDKEGMVLVYRYGCPSWARLPAHAVEQTEKAMHLRRDLVISDLHFDEERDRAWGEHPQVAVAKQVVADAREVLAQVEERIKTERSMDQSTVARKQTAAALKLAKTVVSKAVGELKVTKKEALDQIRPVLRALDVAQGEADKALRKAAVEAGLFWSTGNAVLDDHIQARKQVRAARNAGKAAQRRLPRWSGPVTLSTQIMRQTGKPRRSPEMLASGEGPWRNVVQLGLWPKDEPIPEEWQRHIGTGKRPLHRLLLRVAGASQPPLILPVVLHRPLPEDADISDVQVTRRMVADTPQLAVTLTLRTAAPIPRTTGTTVAVKIGWQSANRDVRIATISTPMGPLPRPVPHDIEDLVREVNGCQELYASGVWRRLLDRDDRIRGYRDQNLDTIKQQVVEALEADETLAKEMAEALDRERLEVARWRSPGRMVRLLRVWPKEHPLWEVMEAWRKRDKHLWLFEAHERQQVLARRKDAYRKMAAYICDSDVKQIVVSGVDIRPLREVPELGKEDTYQARGARANVQWAAPGDFRALLIEAAKKRGIEVIIADTGKAEEHDAEMAA